MNISFRAGINTFLTLETVSFYLRRSIFRKSDVRRTFLCTCLASFDAVFPVSVKCEKRKHRKQGKHSSHRAEISAEKSFLQTHSDNQKYQNDQPYEISIQFKISCMYHGKYIPRTCSLCFTVYTAIAHKYDDYQDHIFQIYKSVCNPVRNLHRSSASFRKRGRSGV